MLSFWILIRCFVYSIIPQLVTTILPTFDMHYLCDKIAGQSSDWRGGFLVFDSDLLPIDHMNECITYLQPKTYGTTYSPGILFSFSTWEMGGDCEDVHMTILDGQNYGTYLQKTVPGLRNPICGGLPGPSNAILASKENFVTIVFHRARLHGSTYRVKFNMTFLSYFEGQCEDYDDTYTCTNQRCIDKNFVCLGLNPCSDNSDCSAIRNATMEETATDWEYILGALKILFFIVAALIAAFILVKIFKGFNCIPCSCKSDNSISRQARMTSVPLRTFRHPLSRRHLLSHRLPLSQPKEVLRSRLSSCTLIYNESDDTEREPTAPSTTYQEIASREQPLEQDITLLPSSDEFMANIDKYMEDGPLPPSYDEINANIDKYMKDMPLPPSYDEFIANPDKYMKDGSSEQRGKTTVGRQGIFSPALASSAETSV